MSAKSDMRFIFSRTDEVLRMSDINPQTSPSKYRVLNEMVEAGELELFNGEKPRKLWEFKRTPGLVYPVVKMKNQPATGIWNVW